MRSLHGVNLKTLQGDGQDLVVVRRVKVFQSHEHMKYPFPSAGPEDAPETLGDLYFAGVYAWDATCLSVQTQYALA